MKERSFFRQRVHEYCQPMYGYYCCSSIFIKKNVYMLFQVYYISYIPNIISLHVFQDIYRKRMSQVRMIINCYINTKETVLAN